MENGEMVAVCLDCFDRLRNQFFEADKYGIPVEKRQYNWMVIPPPPESENSQLITPQERLTKFVRPAALVNPGHPGSLPGPNPVSETLKPGGSAGAPIPQATPHEDTPGTEKFKCES